MMMMMNNRRIMSCGGGEVLFPMRRMTSSSSSSKRSRTTTISTILTSLAVTSTTLFVLDAKNDDESSDSSASIASGADYLRKKILPFRESYRNQNQNDDVPLPRVRILKQGSSTYVASFVMGIDADVIAMLSALIDEIQKDPTFEEINIHTALPRGKEGGGKSDDALISFVFCNGEASVLLVRKSSGRCELNLYRENEMLKESDLDAIASAYVAAYSGTLFHGRRQNRRGIMNEIFKMVPDVGREKERHDVGRGDIQTQVESLGARLYVSSSFSSLYSF